MPVRGGPATASALSASRPRRRCAAGSRLGRRLSHKPPGEPAQSLLRLGSEIGHLVRRERPVRRKVIPHGGAGMHLRERAARFLRRLYATASTRSRCHRRAIGPPRGSRSVEKEHADVCARGSSLITGPPVRPHQLSGPALVDGDLGFACGWSAVSWSAVISARAGAASAAARRPRRPDGGTSSPAGRASQTSDARAKWGRGRCRLWRSPNGGRVRGHETTRDDLEWPRRTRAARLFGICGSAR
jgi:hypothetical protein